MRFRFLPFQTLLFFSLITVFQLTSLTLLAQEEKECGTTFLEEMKQKRFPGRNLIMEFEREMEQKQRERLERFGNIMPMSTGDQVYRIPVVVHIIHRGEPYGEGANIPDEQIFEQMRILNEDFRRQNADTTNTPAIFRPVAADIGIEFVLAKRDPNGNPTTGIVRRQGSRNTWAPQNTMEMANLSNWPSDQYLNIWVANLTFGLIGWAQFPEFNELPGLNEPSPGSGQVSDGVVVAFPLFGVGGNARATSLGRTATHEIGHWLGLRHTWGDVNSCEVDDFVSDTPLMDSPSSGCNPERTSCGGLTMVQNYMDYSSDACMNIFTVEQKGRMVTVLENGIRRRSLLTSPGLAEAGQNFTDLSISELLSPRLSECEPQFSASMRVRNLGNTTISSASFSLKTAGGTQLAQASLPSALAPGATAIINFGTVTTPVRGSQSIVFAIETVNGQAGDNHLPNNTTTLELNIPFRVVLPIVETMNSFPQQWSVRNLDRLFTWQVVQAPTNVPDNRAIAMEFFNHGEAPIGTRDFLLSPFLDFTEATDPELLFRLAYAQRPGQFYADTLIVAYSTDCGRTFPVSNILLRMSGAEMATASSMNAYFRPSGLNQWRNYTIDLDRLKGLRDVQIAFIAVNGRGNNLFLDDITILPDEIPRVDLAIRLTQNVLPAYCPSQAQFNLRVSNEGLTPVNGFRVVYTVGAQTGTLEFPLVRLNPQDVISPNLNVTFTGVGPRDIQFTVVPINAQDINPDNNALQTRTVVVNSSQRVPFRERFEEGLGQQWQGYATSGNLNWTLGSAPAATASNQALRLAMHNAATTTYRMVSPAFDLSNLREASFYFRYSYARRAESSDTLRILAMPACGSAPIELWRLDTSDSLYRSTEQVWIPRNHDDWDEQIISLTQFAGQSGLRLVFEVNSSGANNLFLDDFEFFVQDIGIPVRLPDDVFYVYPNPTDQWLNIAFSRTDFVNVTVRFWSIKGILIHEQFFPDTFNQTYRIDMGLLAGGIYLMEVSGPGFRRMQRVVRR
jgi:hypothetical protein